MSGNKIIRDGATTRPNSDHVFVPLHPRGNRYKSHSFHNLLLSRARSKAKKRFNYLVLLLGKDRDGGESLRFLLFLFFQYRFRILSERSVYVSLCKFFLLVSSVAGLISGGAFPEL